MNPSALPKRIAPLIARHSSSTNADANAKLAAFRQVVNARKSTKRFEPNQDVPEGVWRDILHMTLTSPSGFNLQPTHILLVRDSAIKSALSKHAMLGFGNQYRTNDASGVAVFCTDLEPSKRIDRIYDLERSSGVREDGYMAVLRVAATFLTGEATTRSSSTHLSTLLKQSFTTALSPVQPMPDMENVESWSYKNAGIVAQMYTMAATAHGLSTCMMEGFDSRRAKEILRIPDRYGVPLMVATGYEYGAPPVTHADNIISEDNQSHESSQQQRTPRLEMNELFFGDTFGEPLELLMDDELQIEKNKVA